MTSILNRVSSFSSRISGEIGAAWWPMTLTLELPSSWLSQSKPDITIFWADLYADLYAVQASHRLKVISKGCVGSGLHSGLNPLPRRVETDLSDQYDTGDSPDWISG